MVRTRRIVVIAMLALLSPLAGLAQQPATADRTDAHV